MLGHHRSASETPFKWRFAGGPIMAHYSDIWILYPLINLKKKKGKEKKTLSNLDPSDPRITPPPSRSVGVILSLKIFNSVDPDIAIFHLGPHQSTLFGQRRFLENPYFKFRFFRVGLTMYSRESSQKVRENKTLTKWGNHSVVY